MIGGWFGVAIDWGAFFYMMAWLLSNATYPLMMLLVR
jgi:hypothetical protein